MTRGNSPDMKTNGWFIETQINFRIKKLYRTNQASNFLRGSFSNRDNEKPQPNLEEKANHSILKDDISSKTDPSFTWIAPVLLSCSNKTKWVLPALKSRNYFLSQSRVPSISNSSSEANSSCCHRADAASHSSIHAILLCRRPI